MKKLIFTVYMLLLFIFSATAHPERSNSGSPDKVVVVVRPVDKATVVRKKEARVRHLRLHRREARLERRIHRSHIRSHRRHVRCHH